MMRTIEVTIVIAVILGAFIMSSQFAVLPSPRQVSPINLRRLALSTLQTLDVDHDLSRTVFKSNNDVAWRDLQVALSTCLPPSIVYNLTVYEVQRGSGTQLYTTIKSVSNAENLGIGSDTASHLVTSSNVTFNVVPEKIGELGSGGTLYILNCSDSNSWWITGYTTNSLADDLYNLLSPYFQRTVMVQTTTQLGQILNGTTLQGEPVQNAVVINTCGEAVPIPSGYYSSTGVGYDDVASSFALYCHTLGQRIRQYNWTWVSIVGWPLYYVSNTNTFSGYHNSWGIYGMRLVGSSGLKALLQGLDNQAYQYGTSSTGSPGIVYLSSEVLSSSNYYGIYPSRYQTSTRALPSSILNDYNLTVALPIFDEVNSYIPGAVYTHIFSGDTNVTGSFLALGLTRTPDVRLTALGLLSYYQPRLYSSEYSATGTSRLIVLQLGQTGGV